MTELEKAADNYTEKAENILKYSDGWEEYSDWEYVKKAYINGAEWAIDKACDAFCKFCGHYAIKTQGYTCRQDCGYYREFKEAIMEEKK